MEKGEISRFFFFTIMTLMRNLRFDQGNPHCKGPTIRKVMGGRGIFEQQVFFCVIKFLV